MGWGFALALGALGAGFGIQAYSQYKQGQAASDMHNYNRAVSLRYARAIREIRAYEIAQALGLIPKTFAQQKVTVASAGLEVSGTPLKVMAETKQKLEEQAHIMSYERDLEISRIKAGADISGMRADISRIGGRYGALGTILTGAGSIGAAAYRYGGSTNLTQEQAYYSNLSESWLNQPNWP